MIWSNKEKELLLQYSKKFSKDDMPWELMRPHFQNRSIKALQSKLRDLLKTQEQFDEEWPRELTNFAFKLYYSGAKLSEIRTSIKEEFEETIAVPVIKANMLEELSRAATKISNQFGVDAPSKITPQNVKEYVEWLSDGQKTKTPLFSN